MTPPKDIGKAVPPKVDASLKACDSCRKRKIRCSRETPCSNRKRAGRPCVISPRVTRAKQRQNTTPLSYKGKFNSIDERINRLHQALETLISEEAKSRPSLSSASVEVVGPTSPSPFLRQKENCPFNRHDLPINKDEHFTQILPVDTMVYEQKRKHDKNEPVEGLSSFSAHSNNAIDFLHKVADTAWGDSGRTEIEELLSSMHTIVDAVKFRRQSTQSLFPYSNPVTAQRTSPELPPIQVAVAVIRKSQEQSNLILAVINGLFHKGTLSDMCMTVYFSQDYSDAELLIVNLALYYLLSDTSFTASDEERDELGPQHHLLCQQNAETVLARLSLYMPASHDMTMALVMGAIYGVEMSRPSLAWTLICAAYQSAYSLGYHTWARGSNHSSSTPNQCGFLFWAIYYLEKQFCLQQGRCSTIIDSEITIPLPGSPDATSDPAMDYCRLVVRTGWLSNRIYQELYSIQATNLLAEVMKKVVVLSQEVCAIRDDSRETFKEWVQYYSTNNLPGVDVIAHLAKLDELFWWSTLTLIYRAIPPQAEFGAKFKDDCVAAARAALMSHQDITSSSELSRMRPLASYVNWMILSSPFVPFIVLFCNAIEHEDANDLDIMQTFINSIESATHFSIPIARYYNLFQLFHNVARRFLQLKVMDTASQQGQEDFKSQMSQFFGTLGLYQSGSVQNGFGDDCMALPSIQPAEFNTDEITLPTGTEQQIPIMNWYTLGQQMMESISDKST
ncbi:hypothetical protein FSST1_006780 [Fusarium sambucinum]